MPLKLIERRTDHRDRPLLKGVYALAREDGTIASYKVRWREEGDDGVPRNAGKSFSCRRLGSLDRALAAAKSYREGAIKVVKEGEAVLRPDRAASMTVDELFQEWCVKRGAGLSKHYAEDAVMRWDPGDTSLSRKGAAPPTLVYRQTPDPVSVAKIAKCEAARPFWR
jgi:hypothetical protein